MTKGWQRFAGSLKSHVYVYSKSLPPLVTCTANVTVGWPRFATYIAPSNLTSMYIFKDFSALKPTHGVK